ncbi:uncharacterized protein EI90DRAFT_3071070, partial [Cantharellus anzutake]|uniref:uncharacterized protein n=1 Tax=Cantharellus anzutake TaxID=1750568 RepID=UPI0019081D16
LRGTLTCRFFAIIFEKLETFLQTCASSALLRPPKELHHIGGKAFALSLHCNL